MVSYKEQIAKEALPAHIAIIMDGNGRWAKHRGLDRLVGHHRGVQSVRSVTEAATELGIRYLTLYTFSTENWNRPQNEIDGLMELLVDSIEKETPTFQRNNIRFDVIGDIARMPVLTAQKLRKCISDTGGNTGLTLILALSYSSRWEIVQAAKRIVDRALSSEEIDEQVFASFLETERFPDPDLLIRTSGEVRVSNFLLWQIAYSELYFTDTLWPDFREAEFYKAIVSYQQRERRFGKTSEQL
ncbi:MAG: isoprenyl transferase [Prevotellaceae bacterium]|nr:isoprenyl transferase [Prevotellaceae bacterium]